MGTMFTGEQITQLSKNPCVWHVSERMISYTYVFKKRSLDLSAQGIKPDEIWQQAGFNISIWKKDYCRYTLKDWKRLVRKRSLR